jgi:diguanylate cyclase (GGDEF)-like protein
MSAAPAPRYRLLVADDEPDVHDAYRRVLDDLLASEDKAPSKLEELSAELFSEAPAVGGSAAGTRIIQDVSYYNQGEPAVAAVERACAEGRPFALAFLDMRMPPGIDGLETARRIRAIDPDINILVVTGYSDHRPGEIARVVGSPDKLFYFMKPFEPSELQQLVVALTGRWELERHLKTELENRIEDLQASNTELIESIKRGDALAKDAREQQLRLQAALSNMPNGLCMFDANKRLVICNARYANMYSLPPHLTRPGTPLKDIFDHRVAVGNAPVDVPNYVSHDGVEFIEGGTQIFEFPLEDGRSIRINHLSLSGGGYVATHEDVTEAVRAEARIAHMARYDSLTNLPNRTFFRERLREAIGGIAVDSRVAVLCLDLDEFKGVNDTLGHPLGDALLVAVANRLRECTREDDSVARLGGDEFAIVQAGSDQPERATSLAERLIETLSRPYELDGHEVVIGVSIGIAFAPADGDDPDELLKNADMALYRAKAEGRGTYALFEPSMKAEMQARQWLEVSLRRALANEEFELHYQPLISLGENAVVGFEALLRWRDPERGLVAPGGFVRIAEETGLIIPIGDWVIRRACADAATWPGNLRVAVNLSPVQFRRRHLANVVFAALAASHLPANRLELEITETVLLKNDETTLGTLHQLRDFGVRISMDDFGTGYSSLSYLRSFPFDNIKIDQSFVRALGGSDDALAIVRAVTGLGTALGMKTTAEGVETTEQLECLRREGCTEVQGFLFSEPLSPEQLVEFLSDPKLSVAA